MEVLSIDSLNPSSRAGGASSTDATGMYTTAQKNNRPYDFTPHDSYKTEDERSVDRHEDR